MEDKKNAKEHVEHTEHDIHNTEHDLKAQGVINKNVLWAMGAGLVPFPIVDMAAVSTIQLKMVNELSKHYGIEFSKHRAKNIIGPLVGGVSTGVLGMSTVSLMKPIPVIGAIATVAGMPLVAGATTYALGKVFLVHFASGGTFLDLDPDKVRDYFMQQFEEGKKVAANLKKTVTA
ncbi:MAG: YcjF family protein [SAR324 cluster bacterium]|nr:YcjF family protein [SAR324 cluster bacterium]